jgi:hypothetical protein
MAADPQSRLAELEASADRIEIMRFYDSLPAATIEQMIGSCGATDCLPAIYSTGCSRSSAGTVSGSTAQRLRTLWSFGTTGDGLSRSIRPAFRYRF